MDTSIGILGPLPFKISVPVNVPSGILVFCTSIALILSWIDSVIKDFNEFTFFMSVLTAKIFPSASFCMSIISE